MKFYSNQRIRLSPLRHLVRSQTGEELNELFNRADFAIGSLGRHRSGIYNIKTLKNREYAARGLAFMYSEMMRILIKCPMS